MSKKKNKIVKGMGILKKMSDTSADKRNNKKQKNKPKGLVFKKIGMITFWSLFGFMFLIVIATLFSSGGSNADEGLNSNDDFAENQEAIAFSKDFLVRYFSLPHVDNAKDAYTENLKPYLIDGLDSTAGLKYNSDWYSTIDKRDIVLKDIERIDPYRAKHIYKVKYTLKTDEIVKSEDEDGKRKKETKTETFPKESFISVPIFYSKDQHKYAVYKLPSFTFVNDNVVENTMTNNLKKLPQLTDNYLENNIKDFLGTFFSSYSTDGRDKLSYLLKDVKHQDGLNGTFEYNRLDNVDIYTTRDKEYDKFVVNATVSFRDPETGLSYKNNFLLIIKRDEQSFVITKLNNQNAVDKLVREYEELRAEKEK